MQPIQQNLHRTDDLSGHLRKKHHHHLQLWVLPVFADGDYNVHSKRHRSRKSIFVRIILIYFSGSLHQALFLFLTAIFGRCDVTLEFITSYSYCTSKNAKTCLLPEYNSNNELTKPLTVIQIFSEKQAGGRPVPDLLVVSAAILHRKKSSHCRRIPFFRCDLIFFAILFYAACFVNYKWQPIASRQKHLWTTYLCACVYNALKLVDNHFLVFTLTIFSCL